MKPTTIKDLKDVLIHFQDQKYDDWSAIFWDPLRQMKMKAVFTGLSNPDKEISFMVSDLEKEHDYTPYRGDAYSLPSELPSPFVEGKKAYLMKDENYILGNVKITRYFYECEVTKHQFSTTTSDTYTMCEYYLKKMQAYREKLKEAGIPWD